MMPGAMQESQRCFPPVIDGDTRLLVVGSLPGAASLAAGRYYAHPRNQFWLLMEAVIEEPLAALPYARRLERLVGRGVGLWDTVAVARRRGSLDAAIRLEEASDLIGLAAALPQLRAIGFNGATAARIGRRRFEANGELALIDLPSSSPAYTLAFADKAERWRGLRAYLRPRTSAG